MNLTDPRQAEAFADVIAEFVRTAIEPLRRRLAELEQAQARSLADSFKGAWLPGEYSRGSIVQRSGDLWIAIEATEAKPGQGEGWRLLIRGRPVIHPIVARRLTELRRSLAPDARLEVLAEAGDGSVIALIVPIDFDQPATSMLIDPATILQGTVN